MLKSNFDFLEKPRGYLESDEYLNKQIAQGVADDAPEESKVAPEVRVLHRGGKGGKHLKSAKSLISGVLASH